MKLLCTSSNIKVSQPFLITSRLSFRSSNFYWSSLNLKKISYMYGFISSTHGSLVSFLVFLRGRVTGSLVVSHLTWVLGVKLLALYARALCAFWMSSFFNPYLHFFLKKLHSFVLCALKHAGECGGQRTATSIMWVLEPQSLADIYHLSHLTGPVWFLCKNSDN